MKQNLFATLCSIVFLLPGFFGNTQTVSSKTKQPTGKKNPAQEVAKKETPQAQEPVTTDIGKQVIAVYHFTSAYGFSYDFAMSAGTAVEAGFVRSGRFTVVERNRFGILKEEDKFKEVNTSDLVSKAARLGAKTVVTGHIIAVANGTDVTSPVYPLPSVRTNVSQISLSFKIIDVESGQIMKSETILGKGTGSTQAESMQKAYEEIDRIARSFVAEYLPQRFEFASEVEVDKKGKLLKFKIWGGSAQGISPGDIIEIYETSYAVTPTGRKVEEKKLRGEAKVKEVNSAESATCELLKASTTGEQLLKDIREKPKNIVFEYKGKIRKQGFFK